MERAAKGDRLDAWFDGSAICVIAIAGSGDPLDLSEQEAQEFLAKLQTCIAQAKAA